MLGMEIGSREYARLAAVAHEDARRSLSAGLQLQLNTSPE